MQLTQSHTGTKRDAMAGGARYLVRELIREPVKEAVKEALREEADVRAADDDRGGESTFRTEDRSDDGGDRDSDGSDSGGPSMGLLVLGLVAAVGAVYALRKRGGGTEQSTWSEFEDQASGPEPGEYGSESHATEHEGTAAGESDASLSE